ncbi:MAG TPA: ADOP family duplicated permease, partial [Thermoanaerobaculia bacterium]
VIGVLPAKLRFPFQDLQIVTPHPDEVNFLTQKSVDAGASYLQAGARLAPGVTLETARKDVARVSERYGLANKGFVDARFGVRVTPMDDQLVGPVRSALYLLLGAVLFVLLIGCADVGNLLLAQGLARKREMSIRIALGAARSHILRQMLAEGTALALLGGAFGLLLAQWGLRLLVAANPGDLPRIDEVGIDARVLAFTVVLSLLTGIVFSLAPALEMLRTDIKAAFRDGDRSATGGLRRTRTQGLLVVAEVALALTLLIGAGLLIQSFRRASSVDLGFEPRQLIVTQLSLPQIKYPDQANRSVFFANLLERAQTRPGGNAVALADYLPVEGAPRTLLSIDGRPPLPPDQRQIAFVYFVSPSFFRTLQTKVVEGQGFAPEMSETGPVTGVINETMRREYFPNENPLGKSFTMPGPAGPINVRIVGVASDVQQQGLEVKNRPGFYLTTAQARKTVPMGPFLSLVVRTKLPPAALVPALREAVRGLDPEQPFADLRTMDQIVASSIASRRLTKNLLAGFTAAALALCLLGIYGVVAHSVSLRSKEIGVRMALGAQRVQVLGTVVRQGLSWVLVGIALGLAAALALSRWLASQLFEVSATDPLYLTAGPLALTLVALVACYLPARRATRIEPAVTLRRD